MEGPNQEHWSEDDIERLKKLWLDQGLSAELIGRALGRSRSAILGKVHRLKLSPRATGPKNSPKTLAVTRPQRGRGQAKAPAIQARLAHRADPPPSAAIARVEKSDNDGTALRVPLIEIQNGQCRWPLWNDERPTDFPHCGLPTGAIENSYCERHRKQAGSGVILKAVNPASR